MSISTNKYHILIVGGGVTGLTTAWMLLEQGYKVTVIAKQYASDRNRITSQIAGALWEWPPAVCGRHTDLISLNNSKRWCMTAFERFEEMSNDEELCKQSGVKMRIANFFFLRKVSDDPYQVAKMEEIKNNVKGFRHDPAIIEELGISKEYGVVDAYQHLAPVIDTDRYMVWLYDHVLSLGATLLIRTINGDLLNQERYLLSEYNAHVLINCTGISGLELAGDNTVYPLRGSLIRIINDGSKFPRITQAMSLSLDGREGESDLIFIVPRNDNLLIVGGMAEPNQWDTSINMDNYPLIKEMYDRNVRFYPDLGKGEIDPDYPVAVGLRPFRKQNVRVERDNRITFLGNKSTIIHSYGQGGAGFSLSFGCAQDVVSLVKQVILEKFIHKEHVSSINRSNL